ncbi:MAG: zinc ABC transporter substrate-binding protein [Phascolarctobacterium sp.]|nr:zinc ABC transporter substrate-binding protein [Phascolarctobacterium sp.]
MTMKTLLLLLLIIMNMVAGCGGQQSADKNKLQVAASFYPMAEFASAVGGQHVQVACLVPDGAEPHDWEPSPKDLTRLGRAQVFVYNGMVEPWAQQALDALSERKIIPLEAGHDLFARGGKQDPHVWVSPKKAVVEVQRITEVLCEVDTKHTDDYKANSRAYIAKLEQLDKKLAAVAQKAPRKVFVTAHAAFGHLAADYGLRQLSVAGISAEAEPTPGDLQRLIATVKREKVRYVFFETLTDPKIAKLVAQETGAQTAVLDPLEGLDEEGRKQGLDYLKIMEQNIANLEKALNE